MKKLIITASQVGAIGQRDVNNSVTFGATITSDKFNKVAGTALEELFAWVQVQRDMGAHGLSLSLPIDLCFQAENEDGTKDLIFDTCKALNPNDTIAIKILRQRLKLNNSDKSKHNFAKKFLALFRYVTRSVEERDINKLIEEYGEKARYQDALKAAAMKETKAIAASIEGWRAN